MSGYDDRSALPPIKVIGVGGGGCNAVNRMIEEGITGVRFMAVNTDAQQLEHSRAPETMRIGERVSRGLGVGGDAALGEKAGDESRADLLESVRGMDMVFIAAGMGGGTGTGAAPVVAEVAKQAGALTIAVVTKPFAFEGAKRRQTAIAGVHRLEKYADTVITIPNDRLLSLAEDNITATRAFALADDVLRQGISGIADMITTPGEINLDFNDVKKVMGEGGQALMAIGRGAGPNRAVDAAQAAIASPLLETDIRGARRVLFNVASAGDLGLMELNMSAKVIQEMVDPDAEIIFGTAVKPNLGEEIMITVIATGFPSHSTIEEEIPVAVENDRWSPDLLDAIGLNGDDVELPAFLRRRRVAAR